MTVLEQGFHCSSGDCVIAMEMSLISVLLKVCKNGCYGQDAGLSLVKPWERLFAFCAFFPASLPKEVLWLVDTSGPEISCKKLSLEFTAFFYPLLHDVEHFNLCYWDENCNKETEI